MFTSTSQLNFEPVFNLFSKELEMNNTFFSSKLGLEMKFRISKIGSEYPEFLGNLNLNWTSGFSRELELN